MLRFCDGMLRFFLCAAALLLPRMAIAEPAVRVSVVTTPCSAAAVDLDAFGQAAAMELRAGGVQRVSVTSAEHSSPAEEGPDGPSALIDVAAVPCTEAAQDVEITIVDLATRKVVRRRLAVANLDRKARPRALALAVAELLRASWAELRMPDAAAAAMPVPPSVTAPGEPSRPVPAPSSNAGASVIALDPADEAPAARVNLSLAARFFPTHASTVLGPDVAVSIRLSRVVPLRLRLGGGALFGTSYEPLGSVSAQLVVGGAALVLASRSGPVTVEVGPHLEGGVGRLSGHATAPDVRTSSGSEPVLLTSAQLTLGVLLLKELTASATIDVGGVLVGYKAETARGRVGGFGGPMAGVGIGIGRRF